MVNDTRDGFLWGHISESDEADAVVLPDVVVVRRVAEGERQQALLFQVALMDAREASDDDRRPAQEPWRQRGMFAAAALAIVVVARDDLLAAMRLIVPGDL